MSRESILCFACDWVVDEQGINHIGILFNAARKFKFKLEVEPIILENGLQVQRFILYSHSRSAFDAFIKKSEENTTFSEWFPVKLEDYPEPVVGAEAWHWSVFHAFLDNLFAISLENDSLLNGE